MTFTPDIDIFCADTNYITNYNLGTYTYIYSYLRGMHLLNHREHSPPSTRPPPTAIIPANIVNL